MKKNNVKEVIGGKVFLMLSGFLILVIMACGSNRDTGEGTGADSFDSLIADREFEIENEWLMPLGGNMVNLIGNDNYIRVKGDSVDVFLPYYGVRHSGGGYGSEGGIKYEGIPENFSMTHNEKKNSYMLNFEGNHESENFRFMITIFPNGDTHTSVNSSQRASISYRGELRPLKKDRIY